LRIADQSPDEVAEGAPAYLVGRRDGQQVLGWSVPGAHWVIAIEATSPHARDAAAAAIVSAAVDTSVWRSAGAAPTASAV